MNETHFFLAESRKNVVSHKPATLCISAAHMATKKVVQYCAAVKISEYKIKRRANQTTDLEVVYVDSSNNLGIMTEEQAAHDSDHVSIRPNSNLRADATGFMVYVETQGGKTEGRQKQKYLLLRRNAPYVIRSMHGTFVLNVCLKEPSGVLNLLNWSASQKIQRFAGHTHHVIVPNAEAHTRVSYLATQIDFPVVAQGILVESQQMDSSQGEITVKDEFKQKQIQDDEKQLYLHRPQLSTINPAIFGVQSNVNAMSNPSNVKKLFFAQSLHEKHSTQPSTKQTNSRPNSKNMDTGNTTPPITQRSLPSSTQPFSSSSKAMFSATSPSLQPSSGDSPNTLFQPTGGNNPANSFSGASLYHPKRRFFIHPSQANEFDASEQPRLSISGPIGAVEPTKMEATPVCDTVDCGFNFCGGDDSVSLDRKGPAQNYAVRNPSQAVRPKASAPRQASSQKLQTTNLKAKKRPPSALQHPLPPEGQGLWFDKWVSKLLDF